MKLLTRILALSMTLITIVCAQPPNAEQSREIKALNNDLRLSFLSNTCNEGIHIRGMYVVSNGLMLRDKRIVDEDTQLYYKDMEGAKPFQFSRCTKIKVSSEFLLEIMTLTG